MSKKSITKEVDFKETLWKSADKLRNQMANVFGCSSILLISKNKPTYL